MELLEKDWADLMKYHPAAYTFLLRRSLSNEYQWLKTRQLLNHWQANRLAELGIIMTLSGAAEE